MRKRIKGDKATTPAPSTAGNGITRRRRPADDDSALRGIFATAEDQAGLPPIPRMKKGFERISTDLFDQGYDVMSEFVSIQDALTIKDALSPAHVKDAANKAEDVARRAMRLYVVGKVEFATYTRMTDSIVGAMREAAVDLLEKEKVNKTRTKQITNEDVEKAAAQKFPDEWEDVHNRRVRAKEMMRYLEQLTELSKSRSYTVSRMLADTDRRL